MSVKTVIVVLSTIVSAIQCWSIDIIKCGNRGELTRTKPFAIGNLASDTELKYEDLNNNTVVIAHGYFELHTSTGSEVQRQLHLKDYEIHEDKYIHRYSYKSFSKTWTRATTSGLAWQTAAITLKIKIYKDDSIRLISDVYAGSWWAFTCATANATAEAIQITHLMKKKILPEF